MPFAARAARTAAASFATGCDFGPPRWKDKFGERALCERYVRGLTRVGRRLRPAGAGAPAILQLTTHPLTTRQTHPSILLIEIRGWFWPWKIADGRILFKSPHKTAWEKGTVPVLLRRPSDDGARRKKGTVPGGFVRASQELRRDRHFDEKKPRIALISRIRMWNGDRTVGCVESVKMHRCVVRWAFGAPHVRA